MKHKMNYMKNQKKPVVLQKIALVLVLTNKVHFKVLKNQLNLLQALTSNKVKFN